MSFGLGYTEIAVIMVIALVIIGPRRLPELMRNMGKIMGQLRRASDDLRREIMFSDEINSVRDAMDPFSPPPVPPKLRIKDEDDPGKDDYDEYYSDGENSENSVEPSESTDSTEPVEPSKKSEPVEPSKKGEKADGQ